MTNPILFYSLYPGLVMTLCLFLLHKAYLSGTELPYLKLFANLSVINFFQVIIYVFLEHSLTIAIYAADTYLIAIYFLFTHFMQIALGLSKNDNVSWPKYLYIPPSILTALHISGLMVESYRIEDNTILHNDGIYAFTFDIFVLLASVTTIVTLIANSRRINSSSILRSRNVIAIISFIPPIIVGMTLIILSNTTYIVSVVIIVPSISLYIVIVFYYISRSRIIDFTISLQEFLDRLKTAHSLLSTLKSTYTKRDLDHFNHRLLLLKYKEVMKKHNNNFNAASKELQIHPTTLRNALKNP